MVDNDITNYRDFSLIVRMYSSGPEKVMSMLKEGKIIPLEAR